MTRKLDDQALRVRLLDLIRAGHGRYDAARAVGIDTETFRKYYKKNQDFRDEVEGAWDASAEPIMRLLYDEAQAGDITAAKEWLKHNAPPARTEAAKKVDVHVTHGLDASTISSIADLRARLEGREAPALPEGDYIEAEIIEDD